MTNLSTDKVDRELLAVLVTLEPVCDVEELAPAIRPRLRICDFAALRTQRFWSSGEDVMIDWAEALWRGGPIPIDLARLATLDGDYLLAALRALEVYRGERLPVTA